MDDSWEKRFRLAAQRMRTNTTIKLSNDQKLEVYAYFKQATEGSCHSSKPGLLDFTGRAKWEAWQKLGSLQREQAMSCYVALVDQLDPGWESKRDENNGVPSGSSSFAGGQGGGHIEAQGGVGPVVSRIAQNPEDILPDDKKTAFDWCKEGNMEKMAQKAMGELNQKDKQGMALIHWACDRGHLHILQYLLSNEANINLQDSEGQTALHYACSCGHFELTAFLLSRGVNRNIQDSCGELAEDVCESSRIKALFSAAT